MKSITPAQLQQGLARRFQYCLEFGDHDPDLIVAIHDYINYINKNKILRFILKNIIQKEQKSTQKQLAKLEKSAEKQLDAIIKDIKKRITKKELNQLPSSFSDGNITLFEEYERYKKGKILSSRGRIVELRHVIIKLLEKLYKIRRKNDFEEYVEIAPADRGFIDTIKNPISIRYKKYIDLKELVNARKSISAWGSFEVIVQCYRAIRGYIQEFKRNTSEEQKAELLFIGSAYRSIVTDRPNHRKETNMLFVRNPKKHLKRFHLEVLDQLDAVTTAKSKITDTVIDLENIESEESPQEKNISAVEDIKGKGYFYFVKNKNRIYVSKITARPYKLLSSLIEDIEIYKSVEAVFEDMRIPKDKDNPDLENEQIGVYRKKQIIKNTIKDLQKIEEFQKGRLKFIWNPTGEHSLKMKIN